MTVQNDTETRSVPETLVIVHAVEESGATGKPLGTATLIDREFALAARPLAGPLAEWRHGLRVAAFAVRGGRPESADPAEVGRAIAVEGGEDPVHLWGVGGIADVTRIRIVAGHPDLVFLRLAADLPTPPLWYEAPPTRAELIAGLHAVLDGRPFPIGPIPFDRSWTKWVRDALGWND